MCMPVCFQRNLTTVAKARPAQMIFITTSTIIRAIIRDAMISLAHAPICDADLTSTSILRWSIAIPLALQDQEKFFSSWSHRAYYFPVSWSLLDWLHSHSLQTIVQEHSGLVFWYAMHEYNKTFYCRIKKLRALSIVIINTDAYKWYIQHYLALYSSILWQ